VIYIWTLLTILWVKYTNFSVLFCYTLNLYVVRIGTPLKMIINSHHEQKTNDNNINQCCYYIHYNAVFDIVVGVCNSQTQAFITIIINNTKFLSFHIINGENSFRSRDNIPHVSKPKMNWHPCLISRPTTKLNH